MKAILRTRTARILSLCFILFSAAGIAYEYHDGRVVHPTEWFYYSVVSDGIDINSPTKKIIINREARVVYERYRDKCTSRNPSSFGANPFGAVYRDIQLCNIPQVDGLEFTLRNKYFREKVDRLWGDYYYDHSEKVFLGLFKGLLAWLALLASFVLFNWIKRGD